jgi:hypothetical protein
LNAKSSSRHAASPLIPEPSPGVRSTQFTAGHVSGAPGSLNMILDVLVERFAPTSRLVSGFTVANFATGIPAGCVNAAPSQRHIVSTPLAMYSRSCVVSPNRAALTADAAGAAVATDAPVATVRASYVCVPPLS